MSELYGDGVAQGRWEGFTHEAPQMRIGRDMWDRVGAGSAEFGALGLEQGDRLKKGGL